MTHDELRKAVDQAAAKMGAPAPPWDHFASQARLAAAYPKAAIEALAMAVEIAQRTPEFKWPNHSAEPEADGSGRVGIGEVPSSVSGAKARNGWEIRTVKMVAAGMVHGSFFFNGKEARGTVPLSLFDPEVAKKIIAAHPPIGVTFDPTEDIRRDDECEPACPNVTPALQEK